MTFRAANSGTNIQEFMRRAGYKPIGYSPGGELNCVRPLGGDYPRFHVYLKTEPAGITFNLHLDQKRPSYEGSHAHGGDYESDTVREEAARIRGMLARSGEDERE